MHPMNDISNDQTVREGTSDIVLDGSNSFDSKDGKNLSYEWTQIAGPKVNLKDADKSKAVFNTLSSGATIPDIIYQLTITDKNGLSSNKVTKVTITNVNDPPVAQDQSVTATSGNPTPITLKATDPSGGGLTYEIVSGPESGEITDFDEDSGSLTYTSDDGYTGDDSFTFTASDGTEVSNTATVTVTVINNQNPIQSTTISNLSNLNILSRSSNSSLIFPDDNDD